MLASGHEVTTFAVILCPASCGRAPLIVFGLLCVLISKQLLIGSSFPIHSRKAYLHQPNAFLLFPRTHQTNVMKHRPPTNALPLTDLLGHCAISLLRARACLRNYAAIGDTSRQAGPGYLCCEIALLPLLYPEADQFTGKRPLKAEIFRPKIKLLPRPLHPHVTGPLFRQIKHDAPEDVRCHPAKVRGTWAPGLP